MRATSQKQFNFVEYFAKNGYQCDFCGAFRERQTDMNKHLKSMHSEAMKKRLSDVIQPDKPLTEAPIIDNGQSDPVL